MENVEVDSQIDFVAPLGDDVEFYAAGEVLSVERAQEAPVVNSPWRSMLLRPGEVLRSLLPSYLSSSFSEPHHAVPEPQTAISRAQAAVPEPHTAVSHERIAVPSVQQTSTGLFVPTTAAPAHQRQQLGVYETRRG